MDIISKGITARSASRGVASIVRPVKLPSWARIVAALGLTFVTATLAPMNQDLSPNGSGNVLTSTLLIFELDLTLPCQAGSSFTGGNARLTGRATNYFGGTTTEVLKFVVAP